MNLCSSISYNSSFTLAVLPVVSLNTNIQTSGQNADGVWQLKVD